MWEENRNDLLERGESACRRKKRKNLTRKKLEKNEKKKLNIKKEKRRKIRKKQNKTKRERDRNNSDEFSVKIYIAMITF